MTKQDLLPGVGTALVTPFTANGEVDEESLRRLVARQRAVSFLVPVGSTGEAPTLSAEECRRVVRVVAEAAAPDQPVLAGATSADTRAAIASTRSVIEAGATHVMHATPMYNRPPQRGLLEHFRAIADASTRPIVLYNVPGRTACNMEAETALELAEHPNIVGIKEASGNVGQVSEILRNRPDGFLVYSGEDGLTLPLVAMGADGVISVVSNAAPRRMVELVQAAATGALDEARALHHALTPLIDFAFVDTNPIPIKRVLAHLGACRADVRSPLAVMREDAAAPVARIADSLGLTTGVAA